MLALVLVLAGALLLLSWPRLQASLHYLPVERAIDRYWLQGEIGPEQLLEYTKRARESAAMHSHPRYWEGLNLLHYLQATGPDRPLHERRQAYEDSIEAADRSLALAPVQPRLWLRKAHALNWLSFNADDALSALKMSIYTGRVEPVLMLSRLKLGYGLLGALDDEGKDLLRDQTLLALQMRRAELLRELKRGDLNLLRLRSLLQASHPDVIADLESELAGHVR
jgi:hypothetical protein